MNTGGVELNLMTLGAHVSRVPIVLTLYKNKEE